MNNRRLDFYALGVLAAVLTLGGSSSALAAFTLLDDFDGYDNSVDTRTSLATGGIWASVYDNGGGDVTNNSHVEDTDPNVDPGHGQVLVNYGGLAWRGAEADLESNWGAGLAQGETATYFYQFKASTTGGAFDVMLGLSDDVSSIDTSNAWQDFGVMPFFAGAGDGTADLNMTDAGLPDDDIISSATLDQWYNVWYVINNNAETYDVYWSVGEADGNYGGTASIYRNGFTNTDLNAIGFMAAGDAGSSLAVDNLYYSPGVDTTYPLADIPDLTAIVNTTTGKTILKNLSDSAITFNYYLLDSPDPNNALDPVGWNSLADQEADGFGDFNNDGVVDSADVAEWEGDYGVNDYSDADDDGDSDALDFLELQRRFGQDPLQGQGWEEAGGSTEKTLAELSLFSPLTLDPNESLDLGSPFDPSVFGVGVDGNLSFRYGVPGQVALRFGDVHYVTSGGSATPVPEPTTGALAVLMVFGTWAGIRSRKTFREQEQTFTFKHMNFEPSPANPFRCTSLPSKP